MGFIHVMHFETSNIDEMCALASRWDAARADDHTVQGVTIGKDLDHEGRYFMLAQFESREAAMRGAELSVTQEFELKMKALIEGEPSFDSIDVLYQSG